MKIGFLPLYIKLYDDIGVNRSVLEGFYKELTELFKDRGVEVITSDFCRIKPEFEKAVATFEKENVDAIVTWHGAYSPSLESIEALSNTKLPVIVLDTTPAPEFTPQTAPSEIMWNHGIHGVMDMCSMLKQKGKPYAIAAGHNIESEVIDRVCGFAKSAVAAKNLSNMKVGLFGGSFEGMGDFQVPEKELETRFGIKVENVKDSFVASVRETVTEQEVLEETEKDRQNYDFDDGVIEEEYKDFVKGCLTLRKCIEKGGYNAFSVNFLNVGNVGTMPFTECCKAMARGTGYAGEGDALTSAFTGAFLSAYPETTFVEIFCPDWKGNKVLLSHMGEMNYAITEGKPLIKRTGTTYIKGTMPYAGYAKMKAGKGVYVNISRDKDDYQMLIAQGEMLSAGDDGMTNKMRGWFKPSQSKSTAEFLEKISENGATHHSTFIYGATVEEMEYFAKLLSLKTVII